MLLGRGRGFRVQGVLPLQRGLRECWERMAEKGAATGEGGGRGRAERLAGAAVVLDLQLCSCGPCMAQAGAKGFGREYATTQIAQG